MYIPIDFDYSIRKKLLSNDELNGNKSMRGFRNKKVEVASTTI
jgi:hypothetical protein